jgi:hypothetical protein
MLDYLDFYIPCPAMLSYIDKRPLCNGGSPQAPPPPPPQPAPYRADSSQGEQAINSAAIRQGLRKTILAGQTVPTSQSLGVGNNLLASTNNATSNSTLG